MDAPTPALRFDKRDLLILGAILIVAAALRLTFFRGIVSNDEFNYLRHAAEVWRGRFDPSDIGFFHGTRPVMFVPVSWLFAVFGVSETTAVAWPFAASIATIAAIYWIGARLFDREHGTYAAMLAAWLPLLVNGSTRLLPGAIMNLVVVLSVAAFLCSENGGRMRGPWLFVSGVLLGAMLLTVEIGVIFVVFFVAWIVLTSGGQRGGNGHGGAGGPVGFAGVVRSVLGYWPLAAGAVAVAAGILVYYGVETGDPFFKSAVSQNVLATTASEIKPLYYLKTMVRPLGCHGGVFYLAGVGALAGLIARNKKVLALTVWFVGAWLFVEFASTSLTEYRPLYKSVRYLSVASTPGALLAGAGLVWIRRNAGRWVRRVDAARAGTMAAVLALALVAALSAATLRSQTQETATIRSGLLDVKDRVARANGEVVYVTHWFWNTAVGFFNEFEDPYFPHGYDPYHAVDLASADSRSKNRYVQTLSPGEPMDAGVLIHDLFLFEASRGTEMSYGVGPGEIPEALAAVPPEWTLLQTTELAADRRVEMFRINDGERWFDNPDSEGGSK